MIKNMIKLSLLLLFITFFVGCPSGVLSEIESVEVVRHYTGDYILNTKIENEDIRAKVRYKNGYETVYPIGDFTKVTDTDNGLVSSGFKSTTNENFDHVGEHIVTLTFSYSDGKKTVTKSTDFTINVVDKFVAKYTLTETPVFSKDGKTCTFGDYPQAMAFFADRNDLKLDHNSFVKKGKFTWYVGYDGKYYLETSGGWIYEIMPITWKVLKTEGNNVLLVSDKVLDELPYLDGGINTREIGGKTVYPNNYKHSTIRAFLNGLTSEHNNRGFLQTAFTNSAQAKINDTTVDNSVPSLFADEASVDNTKDFFVCEDTNDKVFLLSAREIATYPEAKNVTFTRYCQKVYGTRDYFALRSPVADIAAGTYNNFYTGVKVAGGSIVNVATQNHTGVLPAIWVTVE